MPLHARCGLTAYAWWRSAAPDGRDRRGQDDERRCVAIGGSQPNGPWLPPTRPNQSDVAGSRTSNQGTEEERQCPYPAICSPRPCPPSPSFPAWRRGASLPPPPHSLGVAKPSSTASAS